MQLGRRIFSNGIGRKEEEKKSVDANRYLLVRGWSERHKHIGLVPKERKRVLGRERMLFDRILSALLLAPSVYMIGSLVGGSYLREIFR